MTEQSTGKDQQLQLKELTRRVFDDFSSRETYCYMGRHFIHDDFSAVSKVISQLRTERVDFFELASTMAQTASGKPEKAIVILEQVTDCKSWQKVFQLLCEGILLAQTRENYPDIKNLIKERQIRHPRLKY